VISFEYRQRKGILQQQKLDTKDDQFQIFSKLYQFHKRIFILESLVGPQELAQISIIGFDPELVVRCDSTKLCIQDRQGRIIHTAKITDPLGQLRRILPKVNDYRYRYTGGAVGFISYDAIHFWERVQLKDNCARVFPLLEFGIYNDGILYNHSENTAYYFTIGKSRLTKIQNQLNRAKGYFEPHLSYSLPKSRIVRSQFVRMVKKAKRYIYQGDIFQVVLSKNISFRIKGDLLSIYSKLREINPSPYMYFLKINDTAIIGSSPEMLVRVTGDYVETFPIAGTRPVVKSEIENERLRKELSIDEKEVAEHTMLVDLARNDLGRVCKYGTVKVRGLMSIKKFSHVQHIVSHVEGYLRDHLDSYDALRAVFPAGTVSGAPKVRAMEIIDELEPHPRELYGGAIGYFSANGSCDFAITIRSLIIKKNKASIQSGAGIVMDSMPDKEWIETQDKASGLLSALKAAAARKR
jgi:anthranilate synthase component I